MDEEMHALAENETWDLLDTPKGVKSIRCRWAYKVKYNINGSVNQYKAQLVVKATRKNMASTTMRRSLRNEHVGCVPIEEVPLRTKANPACLERKDHAATASDGLCDVEIRLFLVHPERSTQTS